MTARHGRDIVTVAASAGGLEPLRTLLAALPADFPASVLVVLHIPATGGRALPRILDRAGVLPAAAGIDGEPLRPGRIYVAPPDLHLLVVDGLVRTSRGARQNGVRPSANPLFRSAACYGGPRTIGVVLSGTLDDGALGAATVEQRGGCVIVQDPDDAGHGSMPRCAVAATRHPAIRPAGKIAEFLTRLTRETVEVPPGEPPADLVAEVRGLLAGDLPITPPPPDFSGFTCLECGGTVQRAMWLAVRSLDERRRLTERLAASARSQGHPISAAHFQAAAEEAARAADAIRGATSKMTPGTGEPPVADRLTGGQTGISQ